MYGYQLRLTRILAEEHSSCRFHGAQDHSNRLIQVGSGLIYKDRAVPGGGTGIQHPLRNRP